ncbi:MAG: hypothetical protein GF364_05685 [Candidatus Lokiarchaeota archaeon]|nr:hypothetical protein [Candidatus Lokiarchaeota archaeon]
MKSSENQNEIEYYTDIISFYEETTEKKPKPKVEIEKWTDFSYIDLMREIKEEKELKDNADVKDVVTNSIILILNLFDDKCQIQTDRSFSDLTKKEKKIIREALLKELE